MKISISKYLKPSIKLFLTTKNLVFLAVIISPYIFRNKIGNLGFPINFDLMMGIGLLFWSIWFSYNAIKLMEDALVKSGDLDKG